MSYQKVRIDMNLSEDQISQLIKIAGENGFQRERPVEKWDKWDKKEAARYAMDKLIRSQIQK